MSLFLSFLLVFVPVMAFAAPPLPGVSGRVTSLKYGKRAPFSGILLDSAATASILANRKYLKLQYDLQLDLEIKKMIAEHKLEFGLLQASYDRLEIQHTHIIKIKDDELSRLQGVIKERSNTNSELWFVGGVVLGIVASFGVFYLSVELAGK